MLKYAKVSRLVWNRLKKAIEKDLDIKLSKEDSGSFTAFKYVKVEYVYESKLKELSIKLPWIVPKKARIKVDGWLKAEIEKSKIKDKKADKKK